MVKSSRTLEYRLLQGTQICMNKLNKNTGQKVTFCATYAGGVFNVKFEDQIMTGAKWIRIVAKRIGHTGCRSAWESGLYVLLKNEEDGKEIKYNMINIPILDKYKQHETEILNNTYLNISKNNNKSNNKSNNKEIKKTNNKKNNMPRKKAAKTNTKQKITDRESAFKVFEYKQELENVEWWNNAQKETIKDVSTFEFALEKRPGCDDVYNMLNKSQVIVGTKSPWKDTENKYPSELKNEDNIVIETHTQAPAYIYKFNSDYDRRFCNMPKLTYFKYKYADIFGGFILTNQITDNNSTLPLPLPPKVD